MIVNVQHEQALLLLDMGSKALMNASQDMDTLSTQELGHLFVRHKKLLVIRILDGADINVKIKSREIEM